MRAAAAGERCHTHLRVANSSGSFMKSVGVREAKARFAELVRAAASSAPTLVTHHGKPVAVITSVEKGGVKHAADVSDPSKFKDALLAIPYPLKDAFSHDP